MFGWGKAPPLPPEPEPASFMWATLASILVCWVLPWIVLKVTKSTPAPLKFYIFGHPVLMSPSPDIHNAGFTTNGAPHRYERYDTEDAAEVIRTVKGALCGGGSVTIPHKESVMPHMDELTDSARRIGAVNTITKLHDGTLRGDNTDWLGIKNQLEAKAPPRESKNTPIVALVCGAGGTAKAAAYALQQMGASRVLIFNRTKSRAEQLAADFGFEAIDDLSALGTSLSRAWLPCPRPSPPPDHPPPPPPLPPSVTSRFSSSSHAAARQLLQQPLPKPQRTASHRARTADALARLDFVVDTLPGSTGFTLPSKQAAILAKFKPTCLEAAYIPRHTAFVKQALKAGCRVVEGVEMLFEQGCAQCTIWTGQPAPRSAIASALIEALFSKSSAHPAAEKMEPRDQPPDGLTCEAKA